MPADSSIEKKIVTGMIVSTEFLQGIAPIYKEQLLLSSTNIVAKWCIQYFKKYSQAPSKNIQSVFKHESKNLEEADRFLIEEFLDRLSKKFKKSKSFNVSYILDIAEEYFRGIAVQEVYDKLGIAIEKGAITRAENIVKKFERTARPISKGVDPFTDEAIIDAFDESTGDQLFKFPGELGDTISYFEREYLTAFFGVRGTGKTWWLLWTGLLGVFAGYNVVFVSLEMSEKQIKRRIHHFLNAKPTKKGKVEIPVFYDDEDDDEVTIMKKQKRKKLTTCMAINKMKDIQASNLLKGNFRLLTYPSGTTTVSDLNAQLCNMEYYEDFVPDVIITDYADKFKPEIDGEMRHKIGDIWKAHKAMGQERKCSVFTASQTNTARSGKDIGVGSAAESMEKENESDVIIALNQKPEQKKKGLMRICVIKHRHNEYDIIKEIYVTQSYSIGRPYLDSRVK